MRFGTKFAQLLDSIVEAKTIAEVWILYMAAAKRLKVEHGIVFQRPGPDETRTQTTLSASLPPGWAEHYAKQKYELIDPLMEYAMIRRRPFTIEEAFSAGRITQRQHRLRAEAQQYGLRAVFVIPDFTLPKTTFIYLYGNEIGEHDLKLLHFAGLEMNARMREIGVGSQPVRLPALSLRERQCLQWAASGKTDWEIGEILSLSAKTANEYIERAKHKLNVPTRTQAIVEAIRHGVIRI